MKKMIFVIIAMITFSFNAISQDTLTIKNLSLQARVVEYLIPAMVNPERDTLYQVFLDLRPKFRVANPPTGTTIVVIDSIETIDLANLYNQVLSSPDGFGIGPLLKAQMATARSANPLLNRLLTEIEAFWVDRVQNARRIGRKMLRGRD